MSLGTSRKSESLALFNLLQQSYQFATARRLGEMWTNVPPADQPALRMITVGEPRNQNQVYGEGQRFRRYVVMIFLRADVEQPDSAPISDTIDDILDGVDNAMQRQNPDGSPRGPGEPQTLGGLVTNCWIDGEVMIDPGITDQQAAIIIPIRTITGCP